MAQGGNIKPLAEGWEVGILKEIFVIKITRLEDHTTCKALGGLKPFGQGGIQWMESGTAIFNDRSNKRKVECATNVRRN